VNEAAIKSHLEFSGIEFIEAVHDFMRSVGIKLLNDKLSEYDIPT
jgi:hypothetical protein